jgi:hypothetical protein
VGNGKTALAVEPVFFFSLRSFPTLPPLLYPSGDIGIIVQGKRI